MGYIYNTPLSESIDNESCKCIDGQKYKHYLNSQEYGQLYTSELNSL